MDGGISFERVWRAKSGSDPHTAQQSNLVQDRIASKKHLQVAQFRILRGHVQSRE